MLAALAAALDGSGPAILPLDPGLPAAALTRTLEAFAPATIETMAGTSAVGVSARSDPPPAISDDTAAVIATSGSTGVPKGVQLSAAALTA